MGGFGSWPLAADGRSSRTVCRRRSHLRGRPEDAERLKTLPIWVFHGTADPVVPFARSVEMVDAIKAAGGTRIRFTTLEFVGHNSWSAAYATPELWSWIEKQSRP